jgi:hypothetical protein
MQVTPRGLRLLKLRPTRRLPNFFGLGLSLVYDAPQYQPPIYPNKGITHPALKMHACNANQILILSSYSLV